MTTDYGLLKFGNQIENAKKSYQAYLLKMESSDELNELRHRFKDGQVLGDDNFVSNIQQQSSISKPRNISLQSILEGVCHVLQIEQNEVIAPGKFKKGAFARGIIAVMASQTGAISNESLASLLKRNASTISSLCSRCSARFLKSSDVQILIEKAKAKAIEIEELQA